MYYINYGGTPKPPDGFFRTHIRIHTLGASTQPGLAVTGNVLMGGVVGYHKASNDYGWTVTHLPTGLAIAQFLRGAKTAEKLCREIAVLLPGPDGCTFGVVPELTPAQGEHIKSIVAHYRQQQSQQADG